MTRKNRTRSNVIPPVPVSRVVAPFREFLRTEASGGILLLLATTAALVWANSPWGDTYNDLWHTELAFQLGGYSLTKSLSHWINEGLMTIFFFVVGLEIKREVLVGELASFRKALLPITAAIGGAILPALIYLALNAGDDGRRGWGVPMATDIAFALGVMALLGNRVPIGLKVFLTALAIADDILAVLVIALFYSTGISWIYLLAGGLILLLLVGAGLAHVTNLVVYTLLGLAVWGAFIQSGVHASVAGVLLAMTIPARTRINTDEFVSRGQNIFDEVGRTGQRDQNILTSTPHQMALHDLASASREVESPMRRLEHALHPWVAWVIVPVFALANAGVAIGGHLSETISNPITLGVVIGLLAGKQVGITFASWVLVRTGLASLPVGVSWRHIHAASVLAGIGFTMSLFIADLAFINDEFLEFAKVGILAASLIAGIAGWLLLRSTAAPELSSESESQSANVSQPEIAPPGSRTEAAT